MSLATRLIILLVVPFAISVSAFGMNSVRLRRALMLSEAEREIRNDAMSLQLTFGAILRERGSDRSQRMVDDISNAADRILGVALFDAAGAWAGASRSVESQRNELRPLARRVQQSGQPEIAKYTVGGVLTYAQAIPTGVQTAVDPKGGVAIVVRDLAYIEHNLAEYSQQIALVVAGLTAALTLAIWLLVRTTVARPLSLLLGGVERVAAGDLGVAAPIERSDEIGRLAAAFNHMTASLRRAADELETKREANLALERRLQHAQRLTLIGQLTATIAHQIGSPLNVILGRAQYALKAGGQSERDRLHFQEIAMGAERVSRIIEQLLSQARRVRGPVVSVDIGKVMRKTVEFLGAECDRHGIVTSLRTEPDIFVDGRRDEVEQVVLNLCLNAIQAQPKGGRLLLSAERAGDSGAVVQIDIADAGPGVDPDLRQAIFEPFFTTKPRGQGTGLGLAICDEMVRRQGGTIRVMDAPGGGALFRITLPRRDAQPRKQVPEAS
jgi:signal transduction histidine kinase